MRLAHELISGYELLPKLAAFEPSKLSRDDLLKYHCDDFIDFLAEVTPQHQATLANHTARVQDQGADGIDESTMLAMSNLESRFRTYGVDNDCPIFSGLYKFCEIYGGGSVGGAWKLNRGASDIAINWSGGLHHAKKAEVSGQTRARGGHARG